MSIQEYRSKRNRTWENQSLTLQEFAAKLNPYLGGTYKNIGDSGTATTIDWTNAKVQELNLNTSTNLTFANGIEGSELTLLLTSDATQKSVIWPSDVTWSQNIAPTISTAQLGGTLLSKPPVGNMGGGFNGTVQFVKTLSTGKILVSGLFSSYSGTFCSQLVRLNVDLTLDTTFTLLNWVTNNNSAVLDAIELSNGNIVVVGGFDNLGNPSGYGNPCLQLLSPNGDRIPTPALFTANVGITVNTIGMQSTGKFIVGGAYFSTPNGSQNIARIDENLSAYDTSFYASINDRVYTLVIDSNDSVYVGGTFNSLDGGFTVLANRGLGKLLSTGQPLNFYFQPTFISSNSIRKLLLTNTGEIYVAGSFQTNGSVPNGIMRFTNVGGYDTTFTGYGTSSVVYDIVLTAEGVIAGIGSFGTYNFQQVTNLVFLDTNGNINTDFLPTTNALSGQAEVIETTLDNNIIVGGYFNSYNFTYAPTIAILTGAKQDAAYTKVDFQYNGNKYIGSF